MIYLPVQILPDEYDFQMENRSISYAFDNILLRKKSIYW